MVHDVGSSFPDPNGFMYVPNTIITSDITQRPQNRKSDAEEEVTLKKYVALNGRNCQVSVKPGSVWMKVYLKQHYNSHCIILL